MTDLTVEIPTMHISLIASFPGKNVRPPGHGGNECCLYQVGQSNLEEACMNLLQKRTK
jgi:hypothetical protein